MKESWRERLNISRIAINAPRLTIAFWLAVAVAGILAFSSLKYALFPDISFPVVIINAQADLATAITTEQQLTKPLENPLFSLPGCRDVSSTTGPGQSVISVFFKIGTNLDKATAAVKQTISQVPLPPQATTEVIPVDLNESATVTYTLVSEQKTLEELSQIAQDNLIPPLKALPGTAKVNLLGQGTVREDNPHKSLTRPLPTLVRFNGQEAIAVQVIKQGAANSLDLVAEAEKLVKDIAQKLPDVKIILAETQAEYIRAALQGTIDDLLLAVLLSVLVILIFLGSFAATVISALVIPLEYFPFNRCGGNPEKCGTQGDKGDRISCHRLHFNHCCRVYTRGFYGGCGGTVFPTLRFNCLGCGDFFSVDRQNLIASFGIILAETAVTGKNDETKATD